MIERMPEDPKAPTDDNDLLRRAREEYQADIDAERENREEAFDDLLFRAGDQWPEGVPEQREADGRPCVTVNRIPQFIRQVTGDIRINKPSIKVRPADDKSDKDQAKVLEGLTRQIESESDAEFAYICGAEAATTCGMGHWRVDTEFADDRSFDQDIRINAIPNPFAVVWDKNAQKPNREDAMHVFVVEELGLDEFKERYPEANTSDFESDQINENVVGDWGNKKTVRVAEYWKKIPVKRELARVIDGQSFRVVDITDMPEPDRAALLIDRTRVIDSFDIEMRIISGVEVLEGPDPWLGRFFPIVSVWGEEVNAGEKVIRHGMVRFAKDPQRIYNYDRTTAVETIGLAPKAPYVGTVKMFEGNEKQWNESNTKNFPYLAVNSDATVPGGLPVRSPPAAVPVALIQDGQIAAEDMNNVTGVHPPNLGAKSNETSGIAIQRRQIEGDVGTFVYIDNLARGIKHTGRILIDLIPKIYDGERIVRILGEDDVEEFVAVNKATIENGETIIKNDLSAGKYDVKVVTGPSFSTKRAEASESMMQFVQAVPQAAELAADLIAKAQDWPGGEEIAERFRKVAVAKGIAEPEEGEESPQPDQGTQMALMEMEIKKLEAQSDLAKAQADIAKSQASAAKTEAETEGITMDNISKAMALAIADSGLETMVARAAAVAVAGLLPEPPVQPQELISQ